MIYLIATILLLSILVFVHELGHFLAAKAVGIRVETFSIGFPPTIFKRRRGDTEYAIGAIPFGGYVRLSGMIDESMDAAYEGTDPQPWEYRSKPMFQKIFVTIAGILMNLLLAVLIFSVMSGIQGIAVSSTESVLETIYENMPAAEAGLQPGDRIVRIDETPVENWDAMANYVRSAGDREIRIAYVRDGIEAELLLTPLLQKTIIDGKLQEVGVLGVSPEVRIEKAGFFRAIGQGFKTTGYWLNMTFVSLKLLVTGQESFKNVGGVIFIGQLAGESAKAGVLPFIGLIGILSVNLALLNILPIPGLDGGHIIIAVAEGIMRREMKIKTKMIIQQVGMFLLFGLIILAVVNDILRLFR
ncbi:MAG: RIP metalloprotease RseP [Candidatus Neomarinimicrobiota bacterium]|jgi:regulator of sigma E protease|nr:RIP metalloprotease RseP [Candidatus Neomarinimicrobiota bacterium]MDD3965461.1 RIP metalloprotease RseP [Candidatus Neomarinimicrobiota bacterium]MDX9780147.1 RIP metalloprotease RseP [bacterium]